jgi:hypothetical protein
MLELFVCGVRLKTCVFHINITEPGNTDLQINTHAIRYINQDRATQVKFCQIHETIMKLRLSYISDRRKTIVFVLTIWEVQMMTMYTGRLELQTSVSMV